MRWKGVLLLRGFFPFALLFWFGARLEVSPAVAVATALPLSESRRFLVILGVAEVDTLVTALLSNFGGETVACSAFVNFVAGSETLESLSEEERVVEANPKFVDFVLADFLEFLSCRVPDLGL